MTTLYLRKYLEPYNPDPVILPSNSSTTLAFDRGSPLIQVYAAFEEAGTAVSLMNTLATQNGPITAPGLLVMTFMSRPLAADVTISGTIAFDIWAYENSMSANVTVGVVIHRIQAGGIGSSVIVNSSFGTELGTSTAQKSWTATPTSTDCKVGDQLMVEVYFEDVGTMSAGYYAYLDGQGAEGATGDTQIRLTETLSFDTSTPAGTTTYLLDTASDVSGSGSKKLWTDAVGTQADKVVNIPSAGNYSPWTDTGGGTVQKWYTPQLQACDVTGLVTAELWSMVSSISANVSLGLYVYVTDADGSNEVLVGAGRAHTSQNASFNSSQWRFPVNASLIDGQRLLLVAFPLSALNAGDMQSGYTGTIRVNYSGLRSGITWPVTLTEYSSGPATIEATGSFAASSGLSATGTPQHFATVSMSATSSMTAVGALVRSAAVTLTASSTFSATGAHTAVATVTMAASSSLTLTATKTAIAAASYAAVSTFTAVGVATRFATVAYTAAAGFTASGATLISATATFVAVSGWAFGGAAPAVRGRAGIVASETGSYWDVSGYPTVSITRSAYNVAPVAGDLLVAFVWWQGWETQYFNPPSTNFSVPAGWTARNGTAFGGGVYGGAIYTKTAAGNSSDDCTWWFEIMDGQGELGVRVFAISDPGTLSYVGPSFGSGTTANIGAVGAAGDLEVADFVFLSSYATPTYDYPSTPAGMTDEGNWAIGYMATRGASLSQSSTGTRSSTISPSSYWGAIAAAVASTAGGGGAVVEKFGAGTFAGSSTFSATGTPDHKATASFAATSSLTAVGETAGGIVSASVSYTASSTFTATGTVTAVSAVAMAATSAFSATGVVSKIAAATYSATSSFSATGVVTRLITASTTIAATSTFTAVSFVFRPATVTFAGSSALTIQAFREISTAITMAASSTLSLTGLVTFFATATFTALADFTTLATPYRLGVLKPNILYGMSGLTGTYTDIDDSPDTPDANALVPSGGAIAVRIGFEDHGYQMRLLAGDQILRVVVKVP